MVSSRDCPCFVYSSPEAQCQASDGMYQHLLDQQSPQSELLPTHRQQGHCLSRGVHGIVPITSGWCKWLVQVFHFFADLPRHCLHFQLQKAHILLMMNINKKTVKSEIPLWPFQFLISVLSLLSVLYVCFQPPVCVYMCTHIHIQKDLFADRIRILSLLRIILGFPGDSVGKETAFSAGDLGLIPGLGRSPRAGNALYYSKCISLFFFFLYSRFIMEWFFNPIVCIVRMCHKLTFYEWPFRLFFYYKKCFN